MGLPSLVQRFRTFREWPFNARLADKPGQPLWLAVPP